MTKNKHLTIQDRFQIETMLRQQYSFQKIALTIGKNLSTISREVRKHAQKSEKFAQHFPANRCLKRRTCQHYQLCEDKPNCTRHCASCNKCNIICPDYEEEVCPKLLEPPYVCNGCKEEYRCVLKKQYYLHKKAQEAYRQMLTESRSGANITEDELTELDDFISPLLKNGLSVHHIFASNPDAFNISEKSIYRYVDASLLNARNLDMPKVVRFRPRKNKPVVHKVDRNCRIGRTYADFKDFMDNTQSSVVEMDTVKGGASGKVLLTMLFQSCDFMLAFLRDRNTSQSVIDCFDNLYTLLGQTCFSALFPVILTDNGSEFSNPISLEYDTLGYPRTRIFYCDPSAPYQKPRVELQHEFIRRILPKGRSFDDLSQEQINLMLSHINSYARQKFSGKAPIDLFEYLYGLDTAQKFGIFKIPPNQIILTPALLQK